MITIRKFSSEAKKYRPNKKVNKCICGKYVMVRIYQREERSLIGWPSRTETIYVPSNYYSIIIEEEYRKYNDFMGPNIYLSPIDLPGFERQILSPLNLTWKQVRDNPPYLGCPFYYSETFATTLLLAVSKTICDCGDIVKNGSISRPWQELMQLSLNRDRGRDRRKSL